MARTAAKLAIEGGPKTVTIEAVDRWRRIGEEEIALVTEMLRREEISMAGGGVMAEFEREFAAYHGVEYALSQCNGTSCMHAAYFAAGVGPGDEVIVPSYTWGNMVSPILHTNGTPVFCEIDPHTLNADPEDIRKRITPRTKAICIVHIWGNVADMDSIMEIANQHNLIVIEDCSHAHGAEHRGCKVGTIGHIGCFSLQGSKCVVAGEGGAIITNDTELYERILILGHQGRAARDLVTDKYKFLGDMGLGWKYRAHPLAMGIAKIQLRKLDEVNAKRAEVFQHLDEGLRNLPGIEVLSSYPGTKRGGFYGYRLLYHPEQLGGLSRSKFIEALQAEGVPADSCRYSLQHLRPIFQNYDFYGKGCPFRCPHTVPREPYRLGDLPITENIYERLIALPVFTEPPEGLLDEYVEAFRKVTSAAERLLELQEA